MYATLKKLLKPAFKAVSDLGLIGPHGDFENELMVKGIKPVMIMNSIFVSPEVQKCVEIGQIVLIAEHPFKDHFVQVYAQSDKIKEGKELYARYYQEQKGYPKLHHTQNAKRIGKLLGFTENDVAFRVGEKYTNSIIKYLLLQTNDFRINIRRYCMLEFDKN